MVIQVGELWNNGMEFPADVLNSYYISKVLKGLAVKEPD